MTLADFVALIHHHNERQGGGADEPIEITDDDWAWFDAQVQQSQEVH